MYPHLPFVFCFFFNKQYVKYFLPQSWYKSNGLMAVPLPNEKNKTHANKLTHIHTHRVKNTSSWRIHSLDCWVLLFHTDENGHLIISMMIKTLKSMWEQEKGREVGLTQNKKHWYEGGLTFMSCWQRDRGGSSLWSSFGCWTEWRAGGGRCAWWGELIMSAVFWQGQEWITCVRLWLPLQFERD